MTTIPQITFPTKYVGETVALPPVSFASRLPTGVTITAATVTASTWAGTDASPSAILDGAATTDGVNVNQKVMGGLDQVTYMLLYSATLSNGLSLEQECLLTVVAEATG